MPKRKYSRKRNGGSKRRRRNNYKRKRRKRIPLGLFASKKLVKLRYHESITLNPDALGTIAYDTISANGMYDPYVGVGGHQPMGFDEYMHFYEHYTVIGAKITATFTPTDTGMFAYGGIVGTAGSSLTGDITTNLEQKSGRFKVLAPAGADRPTKIVKTFSLKRDLGIRFGETTCRGTSSANPSEEWYFQIGAATTGTADPANIVVNIDVEYIAMLTEHKQIAGS